LRKAGDVNQDVYISLLASRNSVMPALGCSPAQLLIGRSTRTSLPDADSAPRPRDDFEDVASRRASRQSSQKRQYDKRVRALPPLHEGQPVFVQPFSPYDKAWSKGYVRRVLSRRTYEVVIGGRYVTRNRKFLRSAPSDESVMNTSEDGDVVIARHE